MASHNLIERRRFLMGLGAFALAAPLAARAKWARRHRVGGASPDAPAWKPVSLRERTHLGRVPDGAEATVHLRGIWGPTSSSDSPDSLIVAHPIVQLTSPDTGRELRRVRWTGNSIRIPPGDACEIFVLSAFWNKRAVNERAATAWSVQRAATAIVEARLSVSASGRSV
jgi:hypothetical protein